MVCGEYWANCLFIQDSQTYQAARTPELAYQGGKGIGMFRAMVADLTTPLTDILPGFHNIRYRFEQWDGALASDAAGRNASVLAEIEWVESRRDEMLRFWSLVEDGAIPTRVAHDDTNIIQEVFSFGSEYVRVENGIVPPETGYVPSGNGDVPVESGIVPSKLGDVPEENGIVPSKLDDVPVENGIVPSKLGDVPVKMALYHQNLVMYR